MELIVVVAGSSDAGGLIRRNRKGLREAITLPIVWEDSGTQRRAGFLPGGRNHSLTLSSGFRRIADNTCDPQVSSWLTALRSAFALIAPHNSWKGRKSTLGLFAMPESWEMSISIRCIFSRGSVMCNFITESVKICSVNLDYESSVDNSRTHLFVTLCSLCMF